MINEMLIKLTENDKRIIFVLLAVLILILVLIAYIGYLVTIVMKWQGKKINNYVTDVVVNGVITNEKDFNMVELWDNRAVGVIENRGIPLRKP